MALNEETNSRTLPGRGALEAYISEAGLICLKQDNIYGGEDSILMLLPTDIPTVISWLEDLKLDCEELSQISAD